MQRPAFTHSSSTSWAGLAAASALALLSSVAFAQTTAGTTTTGTSSGTTTASTGTTTGTTTSTSGSTTTAGGTTTTGTSTGTAGATTTTGTTTTAGGTTSAGTTVGTVTSTSSTQWSDAGRIDEKLLVQRYTTWAGSSQNAQSLVEGLRRGELVTLSGGGATQGAGTTLLPVTRPMGWGNVNRALTLARAELAAQGITQPTADQIKVALIGGTLIGANGQSVTTKGILTLRNQGMGWGQIAHKVNVAPSGNLATSGHYSGGTDSGVVTASGAMVGGSGIQATRESSRHEADEGHRSVTLTAGGSVAGSGSSFAPHHAVSTAASGGIVTASGAVSGGGFPGNSSGHGGGKGHF